MKEIYKSLRMHQQYLEDLGYHVVYIGLYGSHNYNLNDEKSDIDSKAVVLPSLEMLLKKEDLSEVYEVENGQIDVKDIMSFYHVVKKGNPSYLEAIYSDYFLGDKEFRNLFLNIPVNPQAMLGMMKQKREAIVNQLPNSYEKMEEYGHDPKQIHHLKKLFDMILYTFETKDYHDFLLKYINFEKNEMIALKRKPRINQEEAIAWADTLIAEAEQLLIDYHYQPVDLETEVLEYAKRHTLASLINTSHLDYSVDQHRTFGNNIPKKDKERFPQLKALEKKDISYTIYSYLEILDWGKPYEENEV